MNCATCKRGFEKPEIKKGIEIINYAIPTIPEKIVICEDCAKEFHGKIKSGGPMAIVGLVGLLKGV